MNVPTARLALTVQPGSHDILYSFLMRHLSCRDSGYLKNHTPLKSARAHLQKVQRHQPLVINVKNIASKTTIERAVGSSLEELMCHLEELADFIIERK